MHVLVADATSASAASTARFLRRRGMVVDVATDLKMVLALAATTRYDVIVVDAALGGAQGGALRRELRNEHPRVALLVIAGSEFPDRATEVQGEHDGLLARPFEPEQLLESIRAVVER